MKILRRQFLFLIFSFSPCLLFAQIDKVSTEIDSLNQIGNHLFHQKKYDEAISIINKVLAIQEKFYGKDSPELGITLYNLGYMYRMEGMNEKALPLYIQALPLLEKKNPGNIQSAGITRYYIAEMYAGLHDYKNATQWGQQAIPYLKRTVAADDPNLLATINVVNAWRDSINLVGNQSLKTTNKRGDNATITPMSSLSSNQKKAVVDTLVGSENEFYKKFVDLLSKQNINKLDSFINSDKTTAKKVAEYFYNQGVEDAKVYNYKNSVSYLAAAGFIFQKLDTNGYAKCLQWSGYDHLNLKMYEQAIQDYKECLDLSSNDEERLCWINHDLGAVYMALNKFDTASAYFDEALALSEKKQVDQVQGSALRYKGMIAAHNNDQTKAFDFLSRALSVAEKGRDTLVQIAVLRDYAQIYDQLIDYYKEYSSDTTALHLAQLINDPQNQADLNYAIGKLHLIANEDGEAMTCFEYAKKFYVEIDDKDGQLKVGSSLVELYGQSPHSSQTERMYLNLILLAQQISNPDAEATLRSNYGTFLANHGRFDDSYKSLTEASDMAKNLDNDDLSFAVSFNLAENYYQQKNYDRSLVWFLEAEKAIEKSSAHLVSLGGAGSNEWFFARTIVLRTYRRIIELYELRGSFENAFFYADKIKAKLFFEHQMIAMGNTRKELDSTLFDKEEDLKARQFVISEQIKGSSLKKETLDSLVKVKRDIENSLLAINEQFYNKEPRLKLVAKNPTFTLAGLQSLIRKKEALIEYSVNENNFKVFLVTSTHSKEFTISIKHVDLLNTINNLMSPVWKANPSLFDYNASYRLYTSVLQPVISYLNTINAGITDLVIVGDGALNILPFEILVTKISKESKENPQFLVDRFNVRYNISASLLFQKRRAIKEAKYEKQLIAIAPYTTENSFRNVMERTDQSAHNYHWSFLRHAYEEVMSIANYFTDTTLFLNQRAGRNLFTGKPLNTRYLHLATHGYLNSDESSYSGILLNDGLFKQYEILNSDIHADMVVLSACQSGMGQIVGSEGVMGLPRALLTLNVNSVLASLWPVSDEATKDFMNRFYKNLSLGYSKAIALQKAKIWMRNEAYQVNENNIPVYNKHPLFWAPFILIESD